MSDQKNTQRTVAEMASERGIEFKEVPTIRDAFTQALSAPSQPRIVNKDNAAAFLEEKLWEFIDTAAAFPDCKPDDRTWEHVLAYKPKHVPIPAFALEGQQPSEQDESAKSEAAKATGTAGPDTDIFDLIREWAALPEGKRHDAARAIIGCVNRSYSAGVADGKVLAEAARQPAPVAIKTWQERYEEQRSYWGFHSEKTYMEAEIADLRAALAARSQP